MTYATLKDGKFMLFEAEKPGIRDHCKIKFSPSYPCDGSKLTDYYCKCHEDIELFESAKESAIVASDQEHVKNLVDLKILSRGKQDFYPLEGYRIEVNHYLKDSDPCDQLVSEDLFKAATAQGVYKGYKTANLVK